jgi:hypothetical protein
MNGGKFGFAFIGLSLVHKTDQRNKIAQRRGKSKRRSGGKPET